MQLKYIARIISECVVGGWREMKTPQCYSNMKLRLDRRKTVWLFISVKLKHAKGTDIQIVASLYMLFIHRKMSFNGKC